MWLLQNLFLDLNQSCMYFCKNKVKNVSYNLPTEHHSLPLFLETVQFLTLKKPELATTVFWSFDVSHRTHTRSRRAVQLDIFEAKGFSFRTKFRVLSLEKSRGSKQFSECPNRRATRGCRREEAARAAEARYCWS